MSVAAPHLASGTPAGGGRGDRLKNLAEYYEAARKHSDRNFLILPDEKHGGQSRWTPPTSCSRNPVYWTADSDRRPAIRRGSPDLRQGVPRRLPGRRARDGEAREHAHLHAAPASKDRPGTRTRSSRRALHSRELPRDRVRWGMGVDGSEMRLCGVPLSGAPSTI